ncbi:hypothetical protein [Streptomyces sp. 4F14]|uniref:hypothetical protein n=1 Tax=Streptomyces sp. 4F14 TaxID=3394380 RepID=UPI003A864F5B
MDDELSLKLDEKTHIRPVFDPVLRSFTVQLWTDGEPAGTLGADSIFLHPDDILDEIDGFLETHGRSPLTENQGAEFCGMLIMAKGGPDAMLLQMVRKNPEGFLFLE